MSYLDAVRAALDDIRAGDRYRALESGTPRVQADFSSNDYLGLARDSRVVEALHRARRAGSGGARLLGGRHREHLLLEEELAAHVHRERALLFSSGYLAAAGAIGVLAQFVRGAYSDALNHACLIDAMRATRVPRTVYEHARFHACRRAGEAALVVSESVFSMDGDHVDPAALLAQLRPDDVLLVDEAHAIGVAGERGGGLAAGLRDDRVVVMGTLGKALGSMGGFIAGPAEAIELLVNSARPFIFDTSLPPAMAMAARVALMLARGEEGERRRARLHGLAARLRAGLRALGLPARDDLSPIVPVAVGDERRALAIAERALQRGVYAPAVRPPTVPRGTSRLRISVRADHDEAQIDALLEALGCIGIS